jgi:phosphoribosyl 1,2-cyclic phosphodiesterase
MRIKYYGVRGSIPVAGRDYNKYGGNTTCIVINEANTTLVIDAGSGIRSFGRDLIKQAGITGHKINIIFTHYHWDHIMGFPFFAPGFIKGNEINCYGESKYNMSIQDVLKKQQQFINFPVELSGMGAKLHFFETQENDELNIGPFKITSTKLNHPAGTLGYRVQGSSGVFVAATDIEHFSVPDNKLMNLSKDADILMYDSQFTPEEYPKYIGWGHSTWDEGIKIAQLAGVKELHFCHHAPEHNDQQIDDIQTLAQARFAKSFAIQEGWEVEI